MLNKCQIYLFCSFTFSRLNRVTVVRVLVWRAWVRLCDRQLSFAEIAYRPAVNVCHMNVAFNEPPKISLKSLVKAVASSRLSLHQRIIIILCKNISMFDPMNFVPLCSAVPYLPTRAHSAWLREKSHTIYTWATSHSYKNRWKTFQNKSTTKL